MGEGEDCRGRCKGERWGRERTVGGGVRVRRGVRGGGGRPAGGGGELWEREDCRGRCGDSNDWN